MNNDILFVPIEYSKINRRIYQCDNINANGVKQCYRKLTIYKDQSRPKLGLGQSKDYEIVKCYFCAKHAHLLALN
jgi:hypothetical protein